ncbi:radical SAM protein [Candidatus Woesearchaeota archaeon]|nr:radical SAM protein [Candidatus Woesearchaeota archaeon]
MAFVETGHCNWKTCSGELAEGCKRCVRGEKLVLFVTGVCGNGCPYCPVSDAKNMRDVTYANEWEVSSEEDVLEEARLMRATGAGITGGDPLVVLDRTISYITLFKEKFGKDFHIHLYTPLLRVSEPSLRRLVDAGLDEIRFHPRLDDDGEWGRLLLARNHDWSVGVEVPVIPEHAENLKGLLWYLAGHDAVDFVNLNEFEYADNDVFEKTGKHYEPKDALSYGVKGSVELGQELLELASSLCLSAHLCTAKSKDAVQLATRLKRRAERAAAPYDAVDDEGLLTRGAIYDVVSIADEGYGEALKALSEGEKSSSLKRLESLRRFLVDEWGVPEELVALDEERLRLLTTTSVAEAAAEELNTTVALVKEYPTHDCFLVEAEVLRRLDHGDHD